MLARLISLLLLVLTRDGVVHRFDGHHDTTATFARATAVAALADGRVAVLAGGRLLVDGKALPGRFDDERALAGGDGLWSLSVAGVSRVDLRSGKRHARARRAARAPRHCRRRRSVRRADGEIVLVGTGRTWKVAGRPIAIAAGDGKLYVATKAGPLVEIDRTSGAQRDLGLGGWWGTIALAYADHALYAVTVAGKLWRIDPAAREKTIVAMDGWQGAIDLSVLLRKLRESWDARRNIPASRWSCSTPPTPRSPIG